MVKYCHKPYIVDEWRESGFDVDKVWRLEVSITPAEKYLFHDKHISYGNITNQFYIDDFFISLYQTDLSADAIRDTKTELTMSAYSCCLTKV